MIQEAQQQMIRQSVYIDHEKGRAIARLPFLTDPAGKLLDNSRMAERRLESVCKKYSSDVEVKDKINAAFNVMSGFLTEGRLWSCLKACLCTWKKKGNDCINLLFVYTYVL